MYSQLSLILILGINSLLLGGCGKTTVDVSKRLTFREEIGSINQRAASVVSLKCAQCHGPGSPGYGGINYILDVDKLVEKGFLIPGDPEHSKLFQRVHVGTMPPIRPLVDTDKQTLLEWIAQGAAPFDGEVVTEESNPPFADTLASDLKIITDMNVDFFGQNSLDRPFIRYLTLTNLRHLGRSNPELDYYTKALGKLLNSLSWEKEITPPTFINSERLILRIDIRKYRWTPAIWNSIAAAYPYKAFPNNSTFNSKLKAMTIVTGSLPFARADWFLTEVSRPPLYHTILGLPTNVEVLESLLGVDAALNIKEDKVIRAAFLGSNVSVNNRIVERHQTIYGAYWKSYDFSNNLDQQNIFAFPLGPIVNPSDPLEVFGTTDDPSKFFRHAGGEIIFNLPNGLQAYLLINSVGVRLDKAPIEIVKDALMPDQRVTNGISCMSCHMAGMNRNNDEIRPFVAENPSGFSDAMRAKVAALYRPQSEVDSAFYGDIKTFSNALGKVSISAADPDPIIASVQKYQDVVTLNIAASEFGLKPAELSQRITAVPGLNSLLKPLLEEGGSIPRDTFVLQFPASAKFLGLKITLP